MTDARIHDLGYRRYDGPRAGLGWAMASLGLHAVQRVLGLKRAFRHKILPGLVILIAFVPALAYMGLAAVLPSSLEDQLLPTQGEYLDLITQAIVLFTSFVAPEALCTDRRTGMLALYLASPLDRTTYVISKVAAVATVLLTITLLPEVFLLIAYTLLGSGPDGVTGFVGALARITVSGGVLAVYYASFSSVISSFTPRRGIASAAIVVTLLVSSMLTGILLETTDVGDELGLLTVLLVPLRAAVYLLGEAPGGGDRGLEQLSGLLVLATTMAYIVAFSGITWWRYQRVEVDR
jgi:ABC-2 type transport system permease protein